MSGHFFPQQAVDTQRLFLAGAAPECWAANTRLLSPPGLSPVVTPRKDENASQRVTPALTAHFSPGTEMNLCDNKLQ